MSNQLQKNNETMAEFVARKDRDSSDSAKVPFYIACMILVVYLAYLAFEIMDKAAK